MLSVQEKLLLTPENMKPKYHISILLCLDTKTIKGRTLPWCETKAALQETKLLLERKAAAAQQLCESCLPWQDAEKLQSLLDQHNSNWKPFSSKRQIFYTWSYSLFLPTLSLQLQLFT